MLAIEAVDFFVREVVGKPFEMERLMIQAPPDHGHFIGEGPDMPGFNPEVYQFSYKDIEGDVAYPNFSEDGLWDLTVMRNGRLWSAHAAAGIFEGIDEVMGMMCESGPVQFYVNFSKDPKSGFFIGDIPLGEKVPRTEANIKRAISRPSTLYVSKSGEIFMHALESSRAA